ncbi:hypothetical protein [Pyruvatibacter mobilis]|uniref:hypothetical protein n=1 Tax=Pyruvatibacter mobilis TaxID=1712261 RepID=UPI003BABDD3F
MVVAETAAGLGALKAALDIAQGMSNLNKDAEFNLRSIELQQKIIEAQQAAMQSNERQSLLQRQVDELRDAKADLSRYRLVDHGDETFAYELKDGDASGDPPHKICPRCFMNNKKSVLQFVQRQNGQRKYECPECGVDFVLGKRVRKSSSGSSDGPTGWMGA